LTWFLKKKNIFLFLYLFIHSFIYLSIYLIFICDIKCITTLILRVARLPQILYHAQHPTVYAPEPRQYTSILYGLDTGAPYLFCSHINWYFYREWEQKGMESLWFELRLFPIKCWGQHFYSIGTSKVKYRSILTSFGITQRFLLLPWSAHFLFDFVIKR
jgi:hypothetical protein